MRNDGCNPLEKAFPQKRRDALDTGGKSKTPKRATGAAAVARRAEAPEKEAPEKQEPNIVRRTRKDGRVAYRVQIRGRVDGKQHSLARTFSTLKTARKWRDRKLAEIEIHGFPVQQEKTETVAAIILKRLERQEHLGRTAQQMLRNLAERRFGELTTAEVSTGKLYDLADELLAEDKRPQTVACYMTTLAKTLEWSRRRGADVPEGVVRDAMALLWEDDLLARSEKRDRRPDLVELDTLLSLCSANKRQKIPMTTIIVFAIFSCRRLGEICRLRWQDLRAEEGRILVRDMKHPRKKKGNDVWCHLPAEALRLIESMPRASDRIFPFRPESVGTAFRRHRDRAGIADLRFHDLRHEGITRLFEIGLTAPFVAKVSGHMTSATLDRYEHVEAHGDRYSNWKWLTPASRRDAMGKDQE